MALHLNNQLRERIAARVDSGEYPDANAVVEQALSLLDERERLQELRTLIAEGTADVEAGRIREFTPERREELWQQALQASEVRQG